MAHIGVFDSGVGGLTVLREISRRHPQHTYTYFGDTARCPYGGKSPETIIRYAHENSVFLQARGVDCLVVACNTAGALALDHLRKSFHIPVVGLIEPAAREAAAMTKNGKVGVIATRATINSGVYRQELLKNNSELLVVSAACPLLVPIVEEHTLSSEIVRSIVLEYLLPLKREGIDTLLLGCTHYPLLHQYIQEVMEDAVILVDPAQACAEEMSTLLLPCDEVHNSVFQFYVSDEAERFLSVSRELFNFPVTHVNLA